MNHWVKRLIISFLVSLLLEVTVFQYQFYATMGLEENKDYTFSVENMTEIKDDGTYSINKDEDGKLIYEFGGQDVDTLFLQMVYPRYPQSFTEIEVRLTIYDEGNAEGYQVPYRKLNPNVPESCYLRIHPAGKVNKIEVTLTDTANQDLVQIVGNAVNVPIPFVFYLFRVIIVFSVIFSVWSFRAKGEWKGEPLSLDTSWKKGIVVAFVLILTVLFSMATLFFSPSNYNQKEREYIKLTEAFTQGRVDVDVTMPEELLELENPYDVTLRKHTNISNAWDYAFYNGKLYVYFGIAPVITYYLPVYLLTGEFPNIYLEYHLGNLAFVIGCFLLVYEILKRYFPKTNYWIYIILALAFSAGCRFFYLASHPDFYSLAIIAALNSSLYMMYFYLSAQDAQGKVRCYKLVLGSICVGLIAASRPQMLLGCFLMIPVLFPVLFDKQAEKKALIQRGLAFLAPILVFAGGLMYYNYIRFGSVVDFGANYNLTTNDMTKRGFVFDRTGLGLFTFLLELPRQTTEFPFIEAVNVDPLYQGRTIKEAMQGGLLVLAPTLLLSYTVGIRAVYGELKKKKLFGWVIWAAVVGVIIAVADTQMAGILARYQADMGIYFSLGATIIMAAVWEKYKDRTWVHTLARGFLLFTMLGLFLGFLQIVRSCGEVQNSDFFYIFEQIFCFWL